MLVATCTTRKPKVRTTATTAARARPHHASSSWATANRVTVQLTALLLNASNSPCAAWPPKSTPTM
eukprot:11133014-Lingulodinium_polyedra.AAC.1